jgi:flavin reductase (DIM6/NTAB) family NADH-FMN oxidoreductase RutF
VPEFVVDLVPCEPGEQMNATGAMWPHGESEFEKFGIASVPS